VGARRHGGSYNPGSHSRRTIGGRLLHVGHGHGAVGAGGAYAGDVHLQLARHRAHRGHRLDPADRDRGLGVHGVGTLHRADHGAGVVAGLALGRGLALVGDRAALVGGNDLVVRRRVLAADAVAAATVVVAGVLALGALRHRGIDL